jgi:hypothetical protein
MSCRHALVGGNLLRDISAQLNEIRRVLVFTLRRGGQAADPCGSSQTLHNADHRRRAADPCGTSCACIPATLWHHQRVIHHQLASESSNASQPVAQRQPARQPVTQQLGMYLMWKPWCLCVGGLPWSSELWPPSKVYRAVEQSSSVAHTERALVQRAIATTALAWRGRRRLSRFWTHAITWIDNN